MTRPNARPTAPHLPYRSDIDGLRGISILLVIIFHAFPKELPGGFLGVDVFFCISGFLISGIILKALEEGRFSFIDFYNRRAKRIFPNLALTLFASLVIGWFVLLPSEFKTLGKNTFAGAFFVSNVSHMLEASYFDVAAELKPLLHLWSLAIEEQFYLVLPFVMFAANIWLRKRTSIILLLIIGFSFAANLLLISSHPTFTFYALPTRGWELLLGGLLQTLIVNRPRLAGKIPTPIGWFAIAALVSASFVFNGTLRYPGPWALIPVLATLILLLTGDKSKSLQRVLSAKPLVYLGKISFSLYLWHWILLAYTRLVLSGAFTDVAAGIVLIAAILLSVLTYAFWENPIRFSRKKSTLRFAWTSLIACGVLGALIWAETIPARIGERGKFIEEAIIAKETGFPPKMNVIDGKLNVTELNGEINETVVLLGDSLMAQYFATAEALVAREPARIKRLIFLTKFGCTPLPGIEMNRVEDCDVFVREAKSYLESNPISAVVFSSAWAGFLKPETKLFPGISFVNLIEDPTDAPIRIGSEAYKKVHDDLAAWMRTLVERGIKVYVILPNPEGQVLNPRNAINRITFESMPETSPKAPILESQREIRDAVTDVAEKSGATLIDPYKYLCPGTDCLIRFPSGEYVYTDAVHIQAGVLRDKIRYLDPILLQSE